MINLLNNSWVYQRANFFGFIWVNFVQSLHERTNLCRATELCINLKLIYSSWRSNTTLVAKQGINVAIYAYYERCVTLL